MSHKGADLWTMIALLAHKRHRHLWHERAAAIRQVLEQGADPNAGREPPLLLAAEIGRLDIAKMLLDYGADVNAGNVYRTPLMTAGSNVSMRELLLKHGAEENIFTMLSSQNFAAVEVAVLADPQLVHLVDEVDQSLLFYCAAKHDLHSMELLLRLGTDPNAVAAASYGISPIHQVCRGHSKGGREAIALLHQHKANLDARNQGGVTALHMAVRDRNVDAVAALLELGASADIEDRGRKSTALRRAVAHTGRSGTSGKDQQVVQIIKLLLQHGANPQHQNRTGKTVIQSAVNAQIKQLLQTGNGNSHS